MADNRILIKIELEKGGATATLKNFEGEVIRSGVAVKDLRRELGNFVVSSARMSNSVKLTEKELKKLEKTVGGFKSSTGAANAAAMELGRVISDAPYGIRGMANNVSQLASQITFMANATNQATGKSVGFMGAIKNIGKSLLGPTGVLLAIQAVISAIDYFANRTGNATEEVEEFGDALDVARDKVEMFYSGITLDPSLLSSFTMEDWDERAKENLQLLLNEFKDFKYAYDRLTTEEKGDESVVGGLVDKYRELVETKRNIRDIERQLVEVRKNEAGHSTAFVLAKEAELTEKYRIELIKRAKLDEIFRKDSNKKDKRPRVEALDIESASDFNKRMNKIRKESLDLLKDNFDYIKPSELLKVVPEDGEIPEGVRKAIQAYNKAVVDEFLRITQLEEFQEYSELFQDVFSDINTFLQAEFDRQMTIEQNRTNALNEQLNQRLLNEQLSVDQRKAIQNQIWQNDEALRKKQEQIEKKRFRQQKAFNIAMATIDTFRAAAGVLADTKGGTFARIAGMVAVISSGLAQVAVIARQKFQSSAANTPIRAGLGGGTGGGAGDRSFNFTLAGQTEGNQLIDAIQSQFNNPIRAYVVSGDVTNQQQLEANIQSSASF